MLWTNQYSAHHGDLKSGGKNVKDHRRQDEADAFGSAINGSGQTSRLPREMKVQVKAEEMLEDIASYPPDGFLSNAGKNSISQLLKDCCSDPRDTVSKTLRVS